MNPKIAISGRTSSGYCVWPRPNTTATISAAGRTGRRLSDVDAEAAPQPNERDEEQALHDQRSDAERRAARPC
jgi:hypothetical protein